MIFTIISIVSAINIIATFLTITGRKLVAGQSVMHQWQQFDCVVEYLGHWKDNVNHDMLPIKKMDHVIEQVERIREQDHHFMPEL